MFLPIPFIDNKNLAEAATAADGKPGYWSVHQPAFDRRRRSALQVATSSQAGSVGPGAPDRVPGPQGRGKPCLKLKLSGVSKAYGATVALKRGDLEIDGGEVHVLIGSNGSGKSTLCKIVAGSVRPDAGEMLLDGKPVTVSGPQAARALGIGIFYQELSLAAHRTVAENILLPDLPMKAGLFVDRDALAERAARYIALFDGVTGDGFAADATVETLARRSAPAGRDHEGARRRNAGADLRRADLGARSSPGGTVSSTSCAT